MPSYPLQFFSMPEGSVSDWDYFWYQIPYGAPGILTFLVGIFLSYFAFQKFRESKENRLFHVNLAITFVSFGFVGLVLSLRAWIQNVELLVFWNDILYFFVPSLAPAAFYLVYHMTGKKSKLLLYYSYLCWLTCFLIYFGIIIGKGFETDVTVFPFGKYPKGSSFIRPWGIVAPIGYFLLIVPAFVKHYSQIRANYHPSLFHGVNLLFLLICSNAPSILGYKLYPGGFFLFIPMLLVAYGVFRSDFFDVNQLLFQKNGMFYFLFGLLSFVLIFISFGVSFGLSPTSYESSNWYPWGLPPVVSVFAAIFLSIIVAGANPSARLNQLCAFALILTGFYVMQSVPLKLNLPYVVQLRVSQLVFVPFAFAPSIMVRLVFEAVSRKNPKGLKVIDFLCLVAALLAPSPWLFVGYYEYPWSRVHHGGPVEILVGFNGLLALIFILFSLFRHKEIVKGASRWIIGSFVLSATLLLFALFPSHGFPFFPLSDFQFVPAIILGYAVLRHGALSLEGRTIQLSQRLANLGLVTIGIAGILYFPLIRDHYGIGESAFHLMMLVLPLILFNYLVVYIMSRPLAEELDISYFLLDLEKQKADEEREKALIAQDKAEEAMEESEKLLLNILPTKVAQELKLKGSVTPARFESVTVLFTDFKGFTRVAEGMEEQELVQELDACFTQFDEIILRNNLEKLKTIGDSYMCAGGLPVQNHTNAIDACLAALEIQSFMNQLKEIKTALNLPFWELRLGIHTGPVVAGVVGRFKFAYDIWGDTVNTASRMESGGESGKINVSSETYSLVKYFFVTEYRGKIYGKNKGELDMYFVHRLRPRYSQDPDGKAPNQLFRDLYARIHSGSKIRWKNQPE
ncbi:adenylate/guanylate cyclase domain-containing protein [Leptospira ilyithenensis]|uniref:Adenylate/guanylate cyclase domain-containing protein n=1 Tax=Leptospira ilyithenensis TaxID=2484901 RepID=A0A4R9LL97_9LEPT|nr:adenylate/guanylate cyclase domain-containing protein [Leptospira ilyithenensis]TGN07015.1 adenylate/guanylate cyclase domain-containing protein [Leptospira ilyithenensis]